MLDNTGIVTRGENFDNRGFFVDEESSDGITNLLISLYSSPVTPIREIVTNALEVNDNSRGPVEVIIEADEAERKNLISGVSEFKSGTITVTDHGCGMSEDFIRNFFLGLTKSTKNTADNIGGFGIGAKSALYISKNAIWRSTKDGVTTNLIVSRNSKSTDSSITSSYTGEENGTKVVMPVDAENLNYIVENMNRLLFDYQNPEDVKVTFNSVEWPVGSKYEASHGENFSRVDNDYSNDKITIVTKGNIPYAYPESDANSIINSIIKNPELGEYKGVSFNKTHRGFIVNLEKLDRTHIAPNRESLIVSNKLSEIITDTVEFLLGQII